MNSVVGTEVQSNIADLREEPRFAGGAGVSAFLWIERVPNAYNETIRLLVGLEAVRSVSIAFAQPNYRTQILIDDEKISYLTETSLLAAADKMLERPGELFLFVAAPVRMSEDAFDIAIRWMESDPRIGTMSFLSNAGGYLSFPHRNTGTPFGVDGHDEASLTEILRKELKGSNGNLATRRPVPLPVAEGALVVVNRSLLDVCGGLNDAGTNNLSLALAELSLSGARRGFNSFLDASTYVTVPFDGFGPFKSILANMDARHELHQRYPYFPATHDAERDRPNSILAQTLDSVRARAQGLRILIDGSALGPKEMGTQMLIVNLTRALAQRSEVQWVAVGVPDSNNIPHYAQDLIGVRNVRFVPAGALDFPQGPEVDILHRPFQPSGPIPWDRWSSLAKRSVITVQDLIAYRNASYFRDWTEWDSYRDNFNRQIAHCDAVFSISKDVVGSIYEERLPIDSQRVYVVENGADARSADQPSRIPDAMLKRGWAASPFLFVLGATYAHKNRDAAIRVWKRLRERGFPHKLVMVGASVPYGSTRVEEAVLATRELQEHMAVLPEVGPLERNWLLKNTSLAVYLTAAEGFGQVPFEAARMNVPALFVSFGPLREFIDDPALPTSYDVNGLTERAASLLADPALANEAIRATLKNISVLNWNETARKSVEAYFDILERPAHIFRS